MRIGRGLFFDSRANNLSRFDQSVVAILAFVNHSQSLRISVPEDEELVRFAGETKSGLLSGHWLHCITPCGDYAWRTGRRFDLSVRLWCDASCRFRTLLAVNDLFLEFYCLLL